MLLNCGAIFNQRRKFTAECVREQNLQVDQRKT